MLQTCLPERDIMTTLDSMADFPVAGKSDFVSTDAAALASHMNRCASTRSRFFKVHTALETAHSLASPRIVTVAAFAVTFAVLLMGLVSIA